MQLYSAAICIFALAACTAWPLPSEDTKPGSPTSTILATQRARDDTTGDLELAAKTVDPAVAKKKAEELAKKKADATSTTFEPYPEKSPEPEVVPVPADPTPNPLDDLDAPCPRDPKTQAKVTRLFDQRKGGSVVNIPLYGFEWKDNSLMNESSHIFHPQQNQPSEYIGTHTPYQQATGFLKDGVVLDKRYAEQARRGQPLPDKEKASILAASTANYKGGMKIVLHEDTDLSVKKMSSLPDPMVTTNPDAPGQSDLKPVGESSVVVDDPTNRVKTGALYIHTN